MLLLEPTSILLLSYINLAISAYSKHKQMAKTNYRYIGLSYDQKIYCPQQNLT